MRYLQKLELTVLKVLRENKEIIIYVICNWG